MLLLPYALLLIAAVVTLFVKGNTVNKILAIILFVVGMFCISAESGWWRCGFILLSVLMGAGRDVPYHNSEKIGTPVHMIMSTALSILILIKVVIADFFGFDPFWWMMVPALIFGFCMPFNAETKE